MKIFTFLSINFVISFLSDILLYNLSTKFNIIPSLKSYYYNQSILKCGFDAAITIEVALIITMIVSWCIFGILIPKNNNQLFYFCILAFIIGYIIDKCIEKLHIFGHRLDEYYKTYGSGFWGASAFLFSILISYFIEKKILYNI
jgi:hypothetical protein